MNPATTYSPLDSAYPTKSWESKVSFEVSTHLQDLATYIEEGKIILWLHHRVLTLAIKEGKITPPDHSPEDLTLDMAPDLVRARAFNPTKEWHVWHTDQGFQGRKREDAPLSPIHTSTTQPITAIDTDLKLRGVIVTQLDDRSPAETWVLQTRNYIDYNHFHMATYIDQRFLDIQKTKGGVQ